MSAGLKNVALFVGAVRFITGGIVPAFWINCRSQLISLLVMLC
jgi:hypothetical protein